ncbi:DUF4345 domain-containing protein [Subsaximicrobium wynnwilliamsii]|uniref:DUF4345 domain-containing protein n=1 Tax=Subsaximicrobium wynnwilliamsii TaxID=291179 RepID=A0A5C6ZGJ6_9FLAO|nr:DUF4345 domain-containing protein [Subsaximicrobium wynnwilliamsii]TXD82681.1 DUF4345 domain-containing protein [Subsaximicrobium wynnwilliamsii]TXD88416.1 DUF4345 domain-containing protein [Subsaximicrobium wynnwilliamsii]TXE02343.1 DUF4345 domain-containing protein [Subsaximicrobium wynnwilliamsii]
MKTKTDFINKIHLIISACIVVPIAFVYGFNPGLSFDMSLETIDEHNFYKAIMGLYLGFSALWILGVFKNQYLKTAVITNLIFMLGLGFGRIISILMDGIPTSGYVFGTVAELFLGFYGLWVLKRLAEDKCV